MISEEAKNRLLNDIPEIGIKNMLTDEILHREVIKDSDDRLKEITIVLQYNAAIRLSGGKLWNSIGDIKNISEIRKTMETNTVDLKSTYKEYKISNGMNCKIELEFYDDLNILDSFKEHNIFAVKDIKITMTSLKGTTKEINGKDNSLLKDNLKELKQSYEQKLQLLVNNINQFNNGKIVEIYKF